MNRNICPVCQTEHPLIEKSPVGYAICLNCQTKWRNIPKKEILTPCYYHRCRSHIDLDKDEYYIIKGIEDRYYCSYKCLVLSKRREEDQIMICQMCFEEKQDEDQPLCKACLDAFTKNDDDETLEELIERISEKE